MVFTTGLEREESGDIPSEKIKLVPETKCRICLAQCSESSLSLDTPLTGEKNSKPLVFEALELLVKEKVTTGPKYPNKICEKCLDYLETAYELITQYQLSKERIMEQLKEFGEELTNHTKDEVKNDLPNRTNPKDSVEIVIGTEKYSIEDLLIVEGESDDCDESEPTGAFDGFLKNLGTTVSATFVEKGYRKPKIDLEIPSLDIEKLKQGNQCDSEDFELTNDDNIVLPNSNIKYECPYVEDKNNKKKKCKCKICGEVFTWPGSLYYHSKKHVGKKYGCKECDKKFFTAAQARRHNLEVHNKERTVEICQICGKRFHYKSGLYYHMKMHGNIRDLHCSYCPKKFYTQTAIKRHEMTHTGEKPFPCKYCSKKFCSRGERKKHYLCHTGDRPYPCKYCENGFSTLYNLKLHLTTHSGEFPCTCCHKTFADDDILQFHLRRKHKRSKEEEGEFGKIEDGEQTCENFDQWIDEIEPNTYDDLE